MGSLTAPNAWILIGTELIDKIGDSGTNSVNLRSLRPGLNRRRLVVESEVEGDGQDLSGAAHCFFRVARKVEEAIELTCLEYLLDYWVQSTQDELAFGGQYALSQEN